MGTDIPRRRRTFVSTLAAFVAPAVVAAGAGTASASTTRYFCYESGPRWYTPYDTCNQGFPHLLSAVAVLSDGAYSGCASYNTDASPTFSTSRLYACSNNSAQITLGGTIWRYAINHEHSGVGHNLRGLFTYED